MLDRSERVRLVESISAASNRIFKSRHRLILTRLLHPVPPNDDNQLSIQTFRHTRYSCLLSTQSFVSSLLVGTEAQLPPVVLFMDPYWIKKIFGISHRFDKIADDAKTHSVVRFFSVNSYSAYGHSQKLGRKHLPST